MSDVMEACCDNPQLPEGISTGYGLFGDFIAKCENCDYVCAYWECPCELVHECNQWRAIAHRLTGGRWPITKGQ